MPGNGLSRGLICVLLCGLTLGLSGCRHRLQIAPLPPIQKPVELVEIPEPANLPLLEMPIVKLPPPPISAAAARPSRERRRPARTTPTATVPATVPAQAVTSEKVPETAAIGALTVGGESNPQSKQEATDLIASIVKRLNALSTQASDEKKVQINQVRNFVRDAQDALKSGDAEGAKTLATKAKLLMDDMEK